MRCDRAHAVDLGRLTGDTERINFFLFLVLGTASTGALSADVYTCKENGKTVFKDVPCEGVQREIAKHRTRIVEGVNGDSDPHGLGALIYGIRARREAAEKNLTKEERHERKIARRKEVSRTYREQEMLNIERFRASAPPVQLVKNATLRFGSLTTANLGTTLNQRPLTSTLP